MRRDDSVALLMSNIRSRMPSITTKPTFGVVAIARSMISRRVSGTCALNCEKKQVVGVLVGWQSCEFDGSAYHFLTVVWTLLGIEVQHRPLVVRKLCRISEAFAVCECGGNDGTDVESLLALGFACGG